MKGSFPVFYIQWQTSLWTMMQLPLLSVQALAKQLSFMEALNCSLIALRMRRTGGATKVDSFGNNLLLN
jgi:hypothetical protein